MKAYDFGFGIDPAQLRSHPAHDQPISLPDAVPAGWCGGRGPAIPVDAWPRSPLSGYPMVHLFTIALPEEYRRRRPDLVAVSLFQADDHVGAAVDGVEALFESDGSAADRATPYLKAVAAHLQAKHPEQLDLEDIIGGNFAAIWLTEHT